MLQPHGARKPVAFSEVSAATSAAVQSRVKCGVSLSTLEYYMYYISPGQAAAHGGHAKLSGVHAVLLNIHVHMTHTTSHIVCISVC